jgi:2TM domain-containing protein
MGDLMNDEKNESYKRAKKRVEEVKGFYRNLIVYIVINIFLVIINLIFSPEFLWVLFIIVFWGIGLIFHFLEVFAFKNKIFGKKWEEKKIKEYMENEK